MKRVDKSISKKYLPLRLYLDDLEEIEGFLSQDHRISFESGDYQYDSVAELAQNRKEEILYDLEISQHDPYILVELKRTWARVYVASSEPTSVGIFYNIDQLLRRRRRSPSFFYTRYFIWLFNGFVILGNLLLWANLLGHLGLRHLSLAVVVLVIAAAIVLLAAVAWIASVRVWRYSTIVLRHRREARGFFARNRDSLIVAIIAAIIGASLGIIATVVLGQYSHK